MIIVKVCDDECVVFKIRFTIAQTECDVAEQQGMNEYQNRVGLRRRNWAKGEGARSLIICDSR